MLSQKVGVIHGRFQILHYGHLEYLLEGKKRCDFLYIGITNPDPSLTKAEETNSSRSLEISNPLMYFERAIIIRNALLEANIQREEFEIVPFPINYPDLIKYYVPLDATFFITIYDNWGNHKQKVLEQMGLKVDVMWIRNMSERFTSGTEVRELMRTGKKWDHLVPPSVASFINNNNILNRIKNL